MRPTLVLIPGTLCDERVFHRVRPLISHRASIQSISLNKLSNRRNWVASLIQLLPRPCLIAGFSLGGIVALEILRQAPDRVTSIALISSNAEGAGRQLRLKNSRMAQRLRHLGTRNTCKSLKGSYFLSARAASRCKSTILQMASRTAPHQALQQFLLAGRRASGHETLETFSGSIHLISGAQDSLCPPRLQLLASHSAARSTVTLLPRCGHFSPLERPGAVAQALLHWIDDSHQEAVHVYG